LDTGLGERTESRCGISSFRVLPSPRLRIQPIMALARQVSRAMGKTQVRVDLIKPSPRFWNLASPLKTGSSRVALRNSTIKSQKHLVKRSRDSHARPRSSCLLPKPLSLGPFPLAAQLPGRTLPILEGPLAFRPLSFFSCRDPPRTLPRIRTPPLQTHIESRPGVDVA
jgi:hypothetical protein